MSSAWRVVDFSKNAGCCYYYWLSGCLAEGEEGRGIRSWRRDKERGKLPGESVEGGILFPFRDVGFEMLAGSPRGIVRFRGEIRRGHI